MLLKPAWVDNLPNELQECSAGDIMKMILDKVAVSLINLFEGAINGGVIWPINQIPGVDIKRLCIPYKDIKDCRSEAELAELAALLGCSWDDKSLWKRCYYERVRHPPTRHASIHPPDHPPISTTAPALRACRSRRSACRATTWSTATRTSSRRTARTR